jgi:hypothetical protein
MAASRMIEMVLGPAVIHIPPEVSLELCPKSQPEIYPFIIQKSNQQAMAKVEKLETIP